MTHYTKCFWYSAILDLHYSLMSVVRLKPKEAMTHYTKGFWYSTILDLHYSLMSAVRLKPKNKAMTHYTEGFCCSVILDLHYSLMSISLSHCSSLDVVYLLWAFLFPNQICLIIILGSIVNAVDKACFTLVI